MLVKFTREYEEKALSHFKKGQIVEAFVCEQIISKWYLIENPSAPELLSESSFEFKNHELLYMKGKKEDYINKRYSWVDDSFVEPYKESNLTSNHQARGLLNAKATGY